METLAETAKEVLDGCHDVIMEGDKCKPCYFLDNCVRHNKSFAGLETFTKNMLIRAAGLNTCAEKIHRCIN